MLWETEIQTAEVRRTDLALAAEVGFNAKFVLTMMNFILKMMDVY